MAITREFTLADFIREFEEADRNYYSNEGYAEMYRYYIRLSEETGQDIEMNVFSFCMDWKEYDDITEVINTYNCLSDIPEDIPEDTKRKQVVETLEQHTVAFDLQNSHFLIMAF